MKVYVDEIPKCCAECKILGAFDWCNYLKDCVSDEIKNNKRHVLCPLKTTQILKQLAREEVVEEIKGKIKNIEENIWARYGEYGIISDMDYGQIFGLNKLLKVLGRVKGKNDVQD